MEKNKVKLKLKYLKISNFRGIGKDGLEFYLDNLVALVGGNNSGKSTVLKALNLICGDTPKLLSKEDFHMGDTSRDIEIELWTEIIGDISGKGVVDTSIWLSSENYIKEKWIWSFEKDYIRVGCKKDGTWALESEEPKAPFAKDDSAKSYRPRPYYISPFDSHDEQIKQIKKIIKDDIYDPIIERKKAQEIYQDIQKKINEVGDSIKEEAINEEDDLKKKILETINDVFKENDICIENTAQPEGDFLASFSKENNFDIKINDLGLENQGSGMLRVILWSCLKIIADKNKEIKRFTKKKVSKEDCLEEDTLIEKSKILLIDEPEICLHPDTIRRARDVLYKLAETNNWQVVLTTHSPVFIDLQKDNTTITRVDREKNEVNIYKTNNLELSIEEKDRLKILNIFDPYLAEFFFSSKVILVEGDTEYTAFNILKESYPDIYHDVHIIRARGKHAMLPIIKILLTWGKEFAILHDSDSQKTVKGRTNPAWHANKEIRNSKCSEKIIVTKINFEKAFFNESIEKDKPWNTYLKMKDPKIKENIKDLFDFLLDYENKKIPMKLENSIQFNESDEAILKFIGEN